MTLDMSRKEKSQNCKDQAAHTLQLVLNRFFLRGRVQTQPSTVRPFRDLGFWDSGFRGKMEVRSGGKLRKLQGLC